LGVDDDADMMEGTFMNTSIATQFKCICGLLVSPQEASQLDNESFCAKCGTDAPLLFANEAGEVVSYDAPLSAQMQAESDRLSGISR